MAHFAKIDEDGIVLNVCVVDNENLLNDDGVEEEAIGIAYLNTVYGEEFTWIQTSYSGGFRKQFAGIGCTYDKINDVFIQKKPFASWTLDNNFEWQPPTALPDDDKEYSWNEDTKAWDEI